MGLLRISGMGVSSREEIVEVLDALDYDQDRLDQLTFDALTNAERMRVLARVERMTRRLRTPQHRLNNQLDAQAGKEELGGTLRCALADRLRITKAEAGPRVEEAADLGERRALTGEPLEPRLPATAAAQRDGAIGDGHLEGDPQLFRAPARRGRPLHPGGRRGRPGPPCPPVSPRRVGPIRPTDHGHPQPRRGIQRRPAGPQARHHPRPPGLRQDVTDLGLFDPRIAGHARTRAGQVGCARGVQPRRRHTRGRRHTRSRRRPTRHPHHGAAES